EHKHVANGYRFGNKTHNQVFNKYLARSKSFKLRPFEHLMLPVPHRAEEFLKMQYPNFMSECLSRPFSGTNRFPMYDLYPGLKKVLRLPRSGTPCTYLAGLFPMVVYHKVIITYVARVRHDLMLDVIGDVVRGFAAVLWTQAPNGRAGASCWTRLEVDYLTRRMTDEELSALRFGAWTHYPQDNIP
ncbi:unnamed protein product, partial [Polarella glacialis]